MESSVFYLNYTSNFNKNKRCLIAKRISLRHYKGPNTPNNWSYISSVGSKSYRSITFCFAFQTTTIVTCQVYKEYYRLEKPPPRLSFFLSDTHPRLGDKIWKIFTFIKYVLFTIKVKGSQNFFVVLHQNKKNLGGHLVYNQYPSTY